MSRIEIWLSVDGNAFRFPVLPKEIEVTTKNNHQRININEIGEILLKGNEELKELSLSAFFPNQNYHFLEYSDVFPVWESVQIIDLWREMTEIAKLTITGTDIRFDCLIESFTYREQDGTGDIYFDLDLVEYKRLKVRTKATKYIKPKTKRPVKKKARKTYTVKRGDNLWNIAKRFTGNGANYKKIAKDNNIKNPNLIYPKQVIKL